MEKKIISERWDGIDLHASDWKGKPTETMSE